MRTVVMALVGVLLLAGSLHSQNTTTRSQLRAGAAKVDITPSERDLPIATDSIRDHLFARAIVVEDGSTCAVLVGLDLGATPNQVVADAMPSIARGTGC